LTNLLIFFLFFLFPYHAFGFEIKEWGSSSQVAPLHLIFVGLQYPRQELFIEDMRIAQTKLFSLKPFNSLRDAIRTFYVILDTKEEETFFKRREGTPPVMVRNGFVKNLAAQAGAYKLIILDYNGNNTCAELSAIDKISLIIVGRRRYLSNDEFIKGFLHELGHSLGLRDECIHCAKVELGYPNCAPTKELARQWWGAFAGEVPTVDFVNGCCGTYDCVRPSIASLMNDADKASDYGYVDEAYLRREFERMIVK